MRSYSRSHVTLHQGDCLDVLAELADASVDAVVTDPPYGISFMGREWDQPGRYGSTRVAPGPNLRRGHKDAALEAGRYDLSASAIRNFQAWCEQWARECLRVLRPGGHLLAFGGTRTHHRLTCGIEDAGFEIRDTVADLTGYDAATLLWTFGSGFPKSLDVSKAIDQAAGAERQVVSQGVAVKRMIPGADQDKTGSWIKDNGREYVPSVTAPATEEAERWQGWGTALKPAYEPIVVARKPLDGTVAANVLAHGTGALNIDGTRVNHGQPVSGGGGWAAHKAEDTEGWERPYVNGVGKTEPHAAGRWPTNLVLGPAAAEEMDRQSGTSTSIGGSRGTGAAGYAGGPLNAQPDIQPGYGDTGGASRFYPIFRYEAKASKKERPVVEVDGRKIMHPTVKPVALMQWLVRLVTPAGGVVLDPFAGTGATLEAALIEGFQAVGIERDPGYVQLAIARLNRRLDPVTYTRAADEPPSLFDLEEGTA